MMLMKNLIVLIATGLFVSTTIVSQAADKKAAKPYPLDVCIVSGEKLDSMGEPFVFTEKGQEVKLCCKSCQKDFKKDKAKFLKKIDEAAAKKSKAK